MEDDQTPDLQERPMSFLGAAGWTLLVAALFTLALGLSDELRPGANYDLVSRLGCMLLAYGAVFFVMLRFHEPEGSIREVLGMRVPSVLGCLLAAVVGFGLAGPTMFLNSVLASRFVPQQAETEFMERLFATPTMGKKVAVILTMVVVGPLCDELFFRGALFTFLKRGRRIEGVIMATAAYDALCSAGSARELAALMVAALAFATIRGFSSGVWPSVVARVAFWGAQYVPMVAGRSWPASRVALIGSGAAAVVGLGCMALLARRAQTLETNLEDG